MKNKWSPSHTKLIRGIRAYVRVRESEFEVPWCEKYKIK